MKKIILTFLSLLMLTGCGTTSQALAQEHNTDAQNTTVETPKVVEVTNIITQHPTVELEVYELKTLSYMILPENATDKNIYVDLSSAPNLVEAYRGKKDINEITIRGMRPGTGVISLFTSNGKSVSYDVTVTPIPYTPPEDIFVYEAEHVVEYYNYYTPYEHVTKVSTDEFTGWQAHYDFGPAPDISINVLLNPIVEIRNYLPIRGIVNGGFLYHLGDGCYKTEEDFIYYLSVDVSSNWFAAVSIFTYISGGNLMLDLWIYDGSKCLYVGL